MAAPNLFAPTTCTAKTATQAITTSATAVVSNAAASGTLVKVRSLLIANVTGSTSATATVDHYRSTTATRLVYAVSVPSGTTITPLGSDLQIYLEEGDSLRLTASAGSALEAVCSYEVIS